MAGIYWSCDLLENAIQLRNYLSSVLEGSVQSQTIQLSYLISWLKSLINGPFLIGLIFNSNPGFFQDSFKR